jgi:hypothetical protein
MKVPDTSFTSSTGGMDGNSHSLGISAWIKARFFEASSCQVWEGILQQELISSVFEPRRAFE